MSNTTITIQTTVGDREVEVHHELIWCGLLAVHQTFHFSGSPQKHHATVTHIPTGMAVATGALAPWYAWQILLREIEHYRHNSAMWDMVEADDMQDCDDWQNLAYELKQSLDREANRRFNTCRIQRHLHDIDTTVECNHCGWETTADIDSNFLCPECKEGRIIGPMGGRIDG